MELVIPSCPLGRVPKGDLTVARLGVGNPWMGRQKSVYSNRGVNLHTGEGRVADNNESGHWFVWLWLFVPYQNTKE